MTILPLVVFEDIEAWTVATLQASLDLRPESFTADVAVATEVPRGRTERMVIVRRDGGGRIDAVREAPRLGINVYGGNDIEAGDLARLTAALLWAAPDGDPVARVTVTSGPYRVLEESKQARYYFTAELISHGRTAA